MPAVVLTYPLSGAGLAVFRPVVVDGFGPAVGIILDGNVRNILGLLGSPVYIEGSGVGGSTHSGAGCGSFHFEGDGCGSGLLMLCIVLTYPLSGAGLAVRCKVVSSFVPIVGIAVDCQSLLLGLSLSPVCIEGGGIGLDTLDHTGRSRGHFGRNLGFQSFGVACVFFLTAFHNTGVGSGAGRVTVLSPGVGNFAVSVAGGGDAAAVGGGIGQPGFQVFNHCRAGLVREVDSTAAALPVGLGAVGNTGGSHSFKSCLLPMGAEVRAADVAVEICIFTVGTFGNYLVADVALVVIRSISTLGNNTADSTSVIAVCMGMGRTTPSIRGCIIVVSTGGSGQEAVAVAVGQSGKGDGNCDIRLCSFAVAVVNLAVLIGYEIVVRSVCAQDNLAVTRAANVSPTIGGV